MTSAKSTTHLVHGLQPQRLVYVALLVLYSNQLMPQLVRAADPYDALYDVIMTRHGPDGKAYGENESAPSIFSSSDFPFGDKTYKNFNAALDAFEALPQTKIEGYSDIQRALMQRHLWHVFDATAPHQWKQRDSLSGEYRQIIRAKSYPGRRDSQFR